MTHDNRTIRKAVFPVAGMGTRFLPATKAMPKELLPILDKPIIQFAVEEAIEAGITTLVFVTGRTKRAIEDHFDANPELEAALAKAGKDQMLEMVRTILPAGISCLFVRQPEALGLGHAVLCAEPAIGDEPFVVLLPDDLMTGSPKPTRDLVAHFEATGRAAISVMQVSLTQIERYGVIRPGPNVSKGAIAISGIVEKPSAEQAPSNFAAVGRYVFGADVFEDLRKVKAGVGGEIQLTDAINAQAVLGNVDAIEFFGQRYDCGSKFGYLEAIVDHALEHADYGDAFADLLRSRLGELPKQETGSRFSR